MRSDKTPAAITPPSCLVAAFQPARNGLQRHALSSPRTRVLRPAWASRQARRSEPGAIPTRTSRQGSVRVGGAEHKPTAPFAQAESRPRVAQFSLTDEEFDEASAAAVPSGLALGAFAAEVTLEAEVMSAASVL